MSIYSNRFVVLGPNSAAFATDFMASFRRTESSKGDIATMDGVFRTKTSSPSDFSSPPLVSGLADRTKNPVMFVTVISAFPGQTDVPFTSANSPPYEEEQLAVIASAYPHLSFTYLFCDAQNKVFGFFWLKNGIVRKPSTGELELFKRSTAYTNAVQESVDMYNVIVPPLRAIRSSFTSILPSMATYSNRFVVAGTRSSAFAADFMASFHRTNIGQGIAAMDGVFRTKTSVPSDYSSHPLLAGLQSPPKNPVLYTDVISGLPNQTDISFTSVHAPPYDEERLAFISSIYPLLKISYLFCDAHTQVFGFFSLKNGAVLKPSPGELESFKRCPPYMRMMQESIDMYNNKILSKYGKKMNATILDAPCVINRILVTGTGAPSFTRDFMASYKRSNMKGHGSPMDGVFETTKSIPAQAREFRSSSTPFNLILKPVPYKYPNDSSMKSVEFGSRFQPVYEEAHLVAMSKAYPRAQLVYDYASKSRGIYGRWIMNNGNAHKVPPKEMEEIVMCLPGFKKLIAQSE